MEKVLGWSVDLVERPRKPAPEEVLKSWAEVWREEGVEVDWEQLLPPKGFQVLPRRWVVERTGAWHNAHKKLVWCTERVGRVIDFWVAFSDVVIIVRRLIREGWVRYRWEGRPSRRP